MFPLRIKIKPTPRWNAVKYLLEGCTYIYGSNSNFALEIVDSFRTFVRVKVEVK